MHQDSVTGDRTPSEDPLPSLDMPAIRKNVSKSEVDTVFHLPFSALTAPSRLRSSLFRGHRPYWAVNVTDLVREQRGDNQREDFDRDNALQMLAHLEKGSGSPIEDDDEIGSGKSGRLEVWGLTGWYLSLLMRTLRVYE